MAKQLNWYAGAIVVLTTSSAGLQAVEPLEQGFYVAPSLGYYFFDQDNDNRSDDALFYGITLGAQIHKYFSIEAGYYRLESEVTVKDEDFGGALADDGQYYLEGQDVEADMYRLSGLFYFGNQTLTPYALVGYSRLEQDPLFGGDDDMMDVGLGIRYALTPNLSVKGEVRASHSWGNEDTDYTTGLGVAYTFGKAAAPTPKPAEPGPAQPGDADGDGVLDDADLCPDTPTGVEVDTQGCPLDSDQDGVPDYRDQCPGTPAGTKVDNTGCPSIGETPVTIELEVLFDNNKADVKPQYYDNIQKVADFMRQYTNTTAVVEGHTDGRGSNTHNQRLSQRRADAVRNTLISQFGVDPNRLTAIGYGEERPIADNNTDAGRQANRRVVAVVSTVVAQPQQ